MSTNEPFVRDWPWVINFIVTVVVTAVCVLPYAITYADPDLTYTSYALCSVLLVRRQFPRVALIWAGLAAFAQVVLVSEPTFSIVIVPVIIYSAARWSTRTTGLVALLLGLVGSVLGPYRWALYATGSTVAFLVAATACAAIVIGAYLLGRRLNEQQFNTQQRAQSEAERVRLQQAEAEQRARVVAVDERNRIARELHDIVAHSLSVIVVQAEGGRAVVLKRPEVAAEVLDTIADTGRASLQEMRRIVDLLRGGRAEDGYLPSPGLADIPELVQRSGERFELVVFGSAPVVSQAVGLTAYRIVQESLTNVLKHAGPAASARVSIAYTPHTVEIDVTDDGRGAAAGIASRTDGHGLHGMAERVATLHGQLSTGPRAGGGFVVRASLPLEVPA